MYCTCTFFYRPSGNEYFAFSYQSIDNTQILRYLSGKPEPNGKVLVCHVITEPMTLLQPTRHELFRVSEYELCFNSRYFFFSCTCEYISMLKALIGCVGESDRDRDCGSHCAALKHKTIFSHLKLFRAQEMCV